MTLHTFTSESVSAGHPDKVADQISDAILDAYLEQDPKARVACETLVKDNRIILAGEINSTARVDHAGIARDVTQSIGYNSDELGFNGATADVLDFLSAQSPKFVRALIERIPNLRVLVIRVLSLAMRPTKPQRICLHRSTMRIASFAD